MLDQPCWLGDSWWSGDGPQSRGQDGDRWDRASHRHVDRLKGRHVSESAMLVAGMAALLEICGQAVGETGGAGLRGASLASDPVPSETLLRQLGARRLGPHDLPQVVELVGWLSRRAGLRQPPDVYCIPGTALNAFALGGPERGIVAVTEGLLRHLTLDELAGILAHEIAHIRNGDVSTMALAHRLTTATELMSLLGLILLDLDRPGPSSAAHGRSAAAGWLLRLAPTISRLLKLALSRIRELDADLDASHFSGDVRGLISALAKLERQQPAPPPPAAHGSVHALLKSHPETPIRLRRLVEIGMAAMA